MTYALHGRGRVRRSAATSATAFALGRAAVLAVGCAAVLAVGCAAVPVAAEARSRGGSVVALGWLHGRCLASQSADLPFHQRITLVRLDEPQLAETAVITRRTVSSADCPALVEDRAGVNLASGYTFYTVDVARPVEFAIALPARRVLDGLAFSMCSTTDGVRFSVSQAGSVVWSAYYFLGYDQVPTCDEEQ